MPFTLGGSLPAKVEGGYRSIAQVVARLVVVLVHSVAGLEGKSLVGPFLDGLEEVGIDREVEGTEVEVDLIFHFKKNTKKKKTRILRNLFLCSERFCHHEQGAKCIEVFASRNKNRFYNRIVSFY